MPGVLKENGKRITWEGKGQDATLISLGFASKFYSLFIMIRLSRSICKEFNKAKFLGDFSERTFC